MKVFSKIYVCTKDTPKNIQIVVNKVSFLQLLTAKPLKVSVPLESCVGGHGLNCGSLLKDLVEGLQLDPRPRDGAPALRGQGSKGGNSVETFWVEKLLKILF